MRGVEIFFLFVLPLTIAFMAWIIAISVNYKNSGDNEAGPQIIDTFEEMNEDE